MIIKKGNKIISDSRKGVVLDPEKHKNNQNKIENYKLCQKSILFNK